MTARYDEAEDLAPGACLEQQLLGAVNPADDRVVWHYRDEYDLIRRVYEHVETRPNPRGFDRVAELAAERRNRGGVICGRAPKPHGFTRHAGQNVPAEHVGVAIRRLLEAANPAQV